MERARVLTRLIDNLEKRKEEIRELLVTTAAAEYVGHPIQVDMPYQLLGNYAELVRSYHFIEMLPVVVSQSPMGTQVNNSMVYHQPVGVVWSSSD